MKITIIGTGYVGLVSGACFAEIGHDVICIDIDEEKIANLKNGSIPIYEPGLEEIVNKNHKEGRLNFSTDIQAGIEFAEVVFSAVGTPPDEDHKADLKYVKEVAKSFGKYLNEYKVFVNKSTVPVGTGQICEEIIKSELQNRQSEIEFDLVSNPEFLREGCAIKDTMLPDRIVIGTKNQKSAEIMKKLYRPIIRTEIPFVITTIESAEVIKYAANSFLATKISFINEIANFCELNGANVRDVAKGIGLDKRIGSRFLHAGIGYGGSCFPKDVKALIQKGQESNFDFKILKAVEEVNSKQKTVVFDKLKQEIPDLKGKTIAVWGLSFKPKTDDMREAPSIANIEKLLEQGAIIKAYDPVASENAKFILGEDRIEYCRNKESAIEKAEALLIVTEWDEFRTIDPENFKQLIQNPLIIDGRNIYRSEDFEDTGINYISIGQ